MSASLRNRLAVKWLPEHDTALRKHLDAKLSFTQAAAKINGEFRTSYSRNAAIGRANRLGWQSSCPKTGGQRKPRIRKGEPTANGIVERTRRKAAPQVFACDETGLRIADVVPLNLSILQTNDDTCKWPYGENPPFTYCGHPVFDGFPYCASHVALSVRAPNDAWSDQRREEQSARARRTNMRRAA